MSSFIWKILHLSVIKGVLANLWEQGMKIYFQCGENVMKNRAKSMLFKSK